MPGDLVYVLGETGNEVEVSEYYLMMGEKSGGKKGVGPSRRPKVDAGKAKRLYKTLAKAMEAEIVASCKNCSEGGLGIALAEAAFAGGMGIEIDLSKVPTWGIIDRSDTVLFSESPSRFVVTVAVEKGKEFERLMWGNVWARVGRVRDDKRFLIRGLEGRLVIEADIEELKEAYKKTLRW
jgi:phosphoribosylformylglycinamidine synthase